MTDLSCLSPRLGLGSYAYPWHCRTPRQPGGACWTCFDLLDQAVSLKCRYLQLCENVSVERLPDDEVTRLRTLALQAGVQLEVGARGLDQTTLMRCTTIASEFGADFIRLVIDTESDEPSLSQAIDRLRPIAAHFGELGLRLAIENHDRFSARAYLEIVGCLGPAVCGICLDSLNSLGNLEGPVAVAKELAPFVISVHIKDGRAHRLPGGMGFIVTGTSAGDGAVPIREVLEILLGAGREPSVIVETWLESKNEIPPFEEELKMTERSVHYMKSMLESA